MAKHVLGMWETISNNCTCTASYESHYFPQRETP